MAIFNSYVKLPEGIVSCFNCSWRNRSQLFTFALVWRCMSENGYGHNLNKVLPSVSVETDSFWGVVRKGLLSRWGGGLQHWTFHGAQDAEGANNKVLGHPDYVCIKTLDLSKERSSNAARMKNINLLWLNCCHCYMLPSSFSRIFGSQGKPRRRMPRGHRSHPFPRCWWWAAQQLSHAMKPCHELGTSRPCHLRWIAGKTSLRRRLVKYGEIWWTMVKCQTFWDGKSCWLTTFSILFCSLFTLRFGFWHFWRDLSSDDQSIPGPNLLPGSRLHGSKVGGIRFLCWQSWCPM